MQEQELVQKIRDYILNLYKAEYTGLLTVIKTGNEYKFKIGIPSYMAPTSIIGNFETDEEFLDYVYEELRTRNYMRLYIYRVTKTPDLKDE